jgi:hypothetical protein
MVTQHPWLSAAGAFDVLLFFQAREHPSSCTLQVAPFKLLSLATAAGTAVQIWGCSNHITRTSQLFAAVQSGIRQMIMYMSVIALLRSP